MLSGDASCEWAAWFQIQHDGNSWEKRQEKDFTQWKIDHTTALTKCREEWKSKGYTTFIEDQNTFFMDGNSATLKGKPDLVVIKDGVATIIDVKTGKMRESHKAQVMLYMWALPIALPLVLRVFQERQDIRFEGLVSYGNQSVNIPSEAINDDFHDRVVSLIKRLLSREPAHKVPSYGECLFCDITHIDCPERVDTDDTKVSTSLF